MKTNSARAWIWTVTALMLFGAVVSFVPTNVSAACGPNRYYVGSGDWNDTAHWSDSSGGPVGCSVPTSSESVTLDDNTGNIVALHGTSALGYSITGGSLSVTGIMIVGSLGISVCGPNAIGAGYCFSGTGATLSLNGITIAPHLLMNFAFQGPGGGPFPNVALSILVFDETNGRLGLRFTPFQATKNYVMDITCVPNGTYVTYLNGVPFQNDSPTASDSGICTGAVNDRETFSVPSSSSIPAVEGVFCTSKDGSSNCNVPKFPISPSSPLCVPVLSGTIGTIVVVLIGAALVLLVLATLVVPKSGSSLGSNVSVENSGTVLVGLIAIVVIVVVTAVMIGPIGNALSTLGCG